MKKNVMEKDTRRFSPNLHDAAREDIIYALTMFPYPSGSGLHAGHASVFTINDVIARFHRMNGKTVLNPIGFDSFGLPTENYAMKQGKPAYEVTEENKKMFIKQIEALNMSFDMDRIVTTSQPDYYKWTQRIFQELFKAGLVYRDELWVNRCPECQTVLANDQVVDGKCERCKSEIIQKKMPQWFIKITAYAERLIKDLELIDRPEETKIAQKNWIGKSEGAEIDFEITTKSEGDEDTDSMIVINFYDQTTWENIISGKKSIETRALNPDESRRYFGDVKVGRMMRFVNRVTGEFLNVRIKRRYEWKNMEELFADKARHEEIFGDRKERKNWGLDDFKTGWNFKEGYLDQIEEHGMIGWKFEVVEKGHLMTVFTTRPDTIYGVTALVIAPENTLLDQYLPENKKEEILAYRKETMSKTAVQRQQDAKEKTGVFSGVYGLHPLTGEALPIWYADYVLPDYATGSVMLVPGHDERDKEFAEKFGIEIIQVLQPVSGKNSHPDEVKSKTSGYAFVRNMQGNFLIMSSKGDEAGIEGGSKYFLPGGGLNAGENLLEGTMREVQEETGYKHFKQIGQSRAMKSYYYSNWKKLYRENLAHYFLFDLHDTEAGETMLDAYEKELGFEVNWMTADEVEHLDWHPRRQEAFSVLVKGEVIRQGELINSEAYNGLDYKEAQKRIIADLEQQGTGKKKITYKLRDRSVSRQRYWGSPIPVWYTMTGALGEELEPKKFHDIIELTKEIQTVIESIGGKSVVFGGVIGAIYAGVQYRNHDDIDVCFVGVEENAAHEALEENGFVCVKKRDKDSIYNIYTKHGIEIERSIAEQFLKYQGDRRGMTEIAPEEVESARGRLTVLPIDVAKNIKQRQLEYRKKEKDRFDLMALEGEIMSKWVKKTPHLIPEAELPVVLPLDVENYKPKGKSPLEEHATFPWYTKQVASDEKVPFQRRTRDVRAFHEGEEIVPRKTVQGILFDPKKNKYALLSRKNVDQENYTFVLGGVDDGESMKEAASREIQEETGYTDIAFVRSLGRYQTEFWHAVKKRNQHNVTETLLFELKSDANDGHEQEAHEDLEVIRMSKEEILNMNQKEPLRNYFTRLASGEQVERTGETTALYNEYNPAPMKTYLRECDTLDTFMCSAFYFLRYPDAHNDEALCDSTLLNKMFPVDLYTGGKEHTVGHLLYSRFIHKFLYDQGYVSSPEPFAKLVHQGMVLGADGRKMGKRYGNGVDPLDVIEEFGADAMRTYMMFMGPVEQDKAWNDNALKGVAKFLKRIEALLPPTGVKFWANESYLKSSEQDQESAKKTVISTYHKTIQGVTEDIEKMKLNTAVSKLMILVNAIYDAGVAPEEVIEGLVKLVAPFATDLAEMMRKELGHDDDVHYSERPVADESKMVQELINLPIQINGKMRGNVELSPGTCEEDALVAAKSVENIVKYLEEGTIRKVIYVQDKIINIIVG